MKAPGIAIIGASHWHVPLYVTGLKELGVKVCGVHDDDPAAAGRVAGELGAPVFDGVDDLLDKARPDFVFAFAPHSRMPELAKKLIGRKIAFAIEKPVGLSHGQVHELAGLAEKQGVFCSIPFVWRYSEAVKQLKSRIRAGDYVHLAFRFVAGPPGRYLENGSPWMLDIRQVGGGCMTNLGVHFLDLALHLTESTELAVLSAAFHYSHGYSVEDYSAVQLAAPGEVSVSIETGYAFPMHGGQKRDNRWTLVTRDGYHTLSDNGLTLRFIRQPPETLAVTADSDDLYPVFVRETLAEWADGRKPRADLWQMARVRKILDQINETARGREPSDA